MKIKLLSLLIFSSIFVSCTQRGAINNNQSGSLIVDWEKESIKSVPKIKEGQKDSVGPYAPEEQSNVSTKTEKTLTAMVIGPGGYRSIGVISLLRSLDSLSQSPQIVIGHGFSSVIAAYYSLGFKPDFIEWKFFKLIQKLESKEIYRKEWLEEVEANLRKDFANKRIEDGKITLLLPIIKNKESMVSFVKRGDIVDALLANLDMYNLRGKGNQIGFVKQLFPNEVFEKLKVDKIITIDFLNEGIKWRKGDGFLNGNFQKAASLQIKSARENEKITLISFPLNEFFVDDPTKVSDIVHKSKGYTELALKKINKVEKE